MCVSKINLSMGVCLSIGVSLSRGMFVRNAPGSPKNVLF